MTYSESALFVESSQNTDVTDRTPEKTFSPADADNYITTVYSWNYGYIDGKDGSDAGFSIANLQSADGSYATLTEAAVFLTGRFEYTFHLIPSDWPMYKTHRLQVYGRCTTAPEALRVYITMPDEPEVLALTIDSTSNQLYSYDIAFSNIPGLILVRVVDTIAITGESGSEWSIDYIRLKNTDYYTICYGVQSDVAFDTDNIYPLKGSGANRYYRFTAQSTDGDGGNTIIHQTLTCKTEGGTTLWQATWTSPSSFSWWDASGSGASNDYGGLYSPGCSSSYAGNVRTTVFAVYIYYSHPEYSNLDFELYCASSTDDDTHLYDSIYVGNWATLRDLDIHTQITWSVVPEFTDTRCNPEGSIDFTGTARYTASESGVLAGYYDAQVSRTSPAVPSWSTDQWIDTGTFTISCPTVGVTSDENTFQVVLISNQGTTLLGPSSDTVTLDSVEGYDYGVVDDLIEVGFSTTIFTKLRYVSDGAEITGGTLTWSGISMSYDAADGRWEGTTTTETSPQTITYSSINVETTEGITSVQTHPNVSVVWVLRQAILHLAPLETNVLVSTIYDPQEFSIEVYLTDTESNLISGWVNLTIDGNWYAMYCDGMTSSVFHFTPMVSGVYALKATFEGDSTYNTTETSIVLTADPRDIISTFDIPSDITALASTPVLFLDVYDNGFVGEYQGITYVRNFPVNVSYSIWWTKANLGQTRELQLGCRHTTHPDPI